MTEPDPDAPVPSFDDFYQNEFPAMVSLAHTICGDGATAEDLAQEAMSRAHRNWPKISGYDRPGAWLRRVTINLALSRRRRFAREVIGLTRTDPEPATDLASTVDADTEVWDAVAKLPPRQRAVIALFYQDDMTTAEIAEVLRCSVSATTSHLSQARKKLAVLLGEQPPEPGVDGRAAVGGHTSEGVNER